jgi:hypothetical protein
MDSKNEKEKPRVGRALILGGVFGFFASWAGIIGNIGRLFLISAAGIMFAASVCLALGIRLELRNHHWKKWKYNSVASGVVILAFVLGLFVIAAVWQNKPAIEATKKNFTFALNMYEPTEILLTNDFLIHTNFNETGQLHGALVIPVASNESEAILHFGIINDSTTIAEHVNVRLTFLKGPVRAADFGWQGFRSKSQWTMTFDKSKTVTNEIEEFTFPLDSLLSGNACDLPPIAISVPPTNSLQTWSIVGLMARAKDFPTVSVVFAVVIFKVPSAVSPNKPVVVYIKSASELSLGPRELSRLVK